MNFIIRVEIFKKTGAWIDMNLATVYEATLKGNATLELETVFSMPTQGRDKDTGN